MPAATTSSRVGPLIREWRERRRLSQLALATRAEVSTRHLSFVETGRSQPSRELVLHLASELDVPLREQNALLVAAGFAAAYESLSLDDPAMAQVKAAIDLVLNNHEPFPALVIDRQWNVVGANAGALRFVEGADPVVLTDPLNVCRLSLHPKGLGGRLINLDEVAAHLLGRLERQLSMSADPVLEALYDEVKSYPGLARAQHSAASATEPLLATRMRSPDGDLAFFSTVATFGSPHDVTLSELSIELFFPADTRTRDALIAVA